MFFNEFNSKKFRIFFNSLKLTIQNFRNFLLLNSLKKKFDIFLENSKKQFLFFFLIHIFSWKIDKLDPKLAKSITDMCLRHINYFGKKNNLI